MCATIIRILMTFMQEFHCTFYSILPNKDERFCLKCISTDIYARIYMYIYTCNYLFLFFFLLLLGFMLSKAYIV